jgi:hypothetical protein
MNIGNVGSTAAAEAMETPAQTKAEAASGDQQAVQKLARRQAGVHIRAAQAPAAPAAPEAPAVSADGKLDAKA